ncbi:MAG: GNAT family N-acetyltransferase [Dehalococcoidia bacterium]
MTVRPARLTDADTIFEMLGRFATSYAPDRAVFDESLPQMIADDRVTLLIAEEHTAAVGYVMAVEFQTLFANGSVVQVEELFVEEESRGRGMGRALLDTVLAWSRERQAVEVTVPTRRAGDYYERLGFERAAEYFRLRLTA